MDQHEASLLTPLFADENLNAAAADEEQSEAPSVARAEPEAQVQDELLCEYSDDEPAPHPVGPAAAHVPDPPVAWQCKRARDADSMDGPAVVVGRVTATTRIWAAPEVRWSNVVIDAEAKEWSADEPTHEISTAEELPFGAVASLRAKGRSGKVARKYEGVAAVTDDRLWTTIGVPDAEGQPTVVISEEQRRVVVNAADDNIFVHKAGPEGMRGTLPVRKLVCTVQKRKPRACVEKRVSIFAIGEAVTEIPWDEHVGRWLLCRWLTSHGPAGNAELQVAGNAFIRVLPDGIAPPATP